MDEKQNNNSVLTIKKPLVMALAILSIVIGAIYFFSGAICFVSIENAASVFQGIVFFISGAILLIGGIFNLIYFDKKDDTSFVLTIFSYLALPAAFSLVYLIQGFTYIGTDYAYMIAVGILFFLISGAALALAIIALFALDKWKASFRYLLMTSAITMIVLSAFNFLTNYLNLTLTSANAIESMMSMFVGFVGIAIPSLFLALVVTAKVNEEEIEENEETKEEAEENADGE